MDISIPNQHNNITVLDKSIPVYILNNNNVPDCIMIIILYPKPGQLLNKHRFNILLKSDNFFTNRIDKKPTLNRVRPHDADIIFQHRFKRLIFIFSTFYREVITPLNQVFPKLKKQFSKTHDQVDFIQLIPIVFKMNSSHFFQNQYTETICI